MWSVSSRKTRKQECVFHKAKIHDNRIEEVFNEWLEIEEQAAGKFRQQAATAAWSYPDSRRRVGDQHLRRMLRCVSKKQVIVFNKPEKCRSRASSKKQAPTSAHSHSHSRESSDQSQVQ